MISRKSIDEIFSTARLEEVIGDFVQLKKSGSNFKGLSPFSSEKTPSFMVSPTKQIWKDFSSGKGGNVVSFLMEHEQFTYPEALRWLAKKYNIEIEEESVERTEEQKQELQLKEALFLLNEFARKFFEDQLYNTEEGKNIGLSYFKERGFSNEIIQEFSLGYSPKTWDAFAEYAKQKGYSDDLLEKSGLVSFKGDKKFDRFRERVIFPIQNFSGRTLGFGARILRNDVKAAKYLNSPETEIYHKSKILYGIFQSKKEILKQDLCYLVEGYTDVISLHQTGIKNVVASSGTALTEDQIRLIKRLTPNVTMLYDGDDAGIRASFRGIDLILKQELNVRVLLFPEGEDPDSFAQKKSSSELKEFLLNESIDFIEFKSNILLKDAKNDPTKKANVIREIVQSIALIPNLIQREIYIRETAKRFDFREEILFGELAQLINKSEREVYKNNKKQQESLTKLETTQKAPEVDSLLLIERELIALILEYGDRVITVKEEDEEFETTIIEEIIFKLNEDNLEFKHPVHQLVLEHLKVGLEENELRAADYFMKLENVELNQLISECLMDQHHISPNWEKQGIYIKSLNEGLNKKLEDTLLRFKHLHLNLIISDSTDLLNSEYLEGSVRIEQIQKIKKFISFNNQIKLHLNQVV